MNPAMAPASTVDAQVCAWLAAVLRDGAGAEPPVAAGAAVATAQPQPQPPLQVAVADLDANVRGLSVGGFLNYEEAESDE